MKIIREHKTDIPFSNDLDWYEARFDSISELAEYANSDTQRVFDHHSKLNKPRQSWDFGAGFDGAMAMVNNGWPKGAEKIAELAKAMYDKIIPKVNAFTGTEHAVSGACVDVGAYLTGVPECMIEFVPQDNIGTRPITMIISSGVNGGTDADYINNRGAAILAAIDALEQRGCAVSVEMESTVVPYQHDTDHYVTYRTMIKHHGQVFDIDALAFPLTHPAFHRRLVFGAREHAPDRYFKALDIPIRYGYSTDYPESFDADTIYIGTINNDISAYSTPERAVVAVLKALEPTGLITDTVLV